MTTPFPTDEINGTAQAVTTASPADGAAAVQSPTPEMRAVLQKYREAVQLGVGQVVLATLDLPRYRHQTLADVAQQFVAPLMRDRVAIARRAAAGPDGTDTDEMTVVGIALWATVSDAVDAKITEQIRAGVFPVRLGPDDWASGETVWLLDVIAQDRQQATSVLTNFRQLAGERPVKIAPLVARLIDPAVLAKLRGEVAEEAANQAAAAAMPGGDAPAGVDVVRH